MCAVRSAAPSSRLIVNADEMAAACAAACHANTLIFLTDVPGVKDASGEVMPWLTTKQAAELMAAVQDAVRLLRRVFQPEGFNVGVNIGKVAGAGIPGHVHVHVVPRWNGDTNFMPVLAETKVVNEHLERTWEKLAAAFSAET